MSSQAAPAKTAPRDADSGVSSVVAAVLLFGLFTTMFTMFTVNQLPQWQADNEHTHQEEVRAGLAAVKSSLEALSVRSDAGAVSVPFSLGTPTVPFLQSEQATGTLALSSGAQGLAIQGTVSGAQLLLADGIPQMSSGVALGDACGAGAKCITALEGLSLYLITSGNSSTAAVTVTATGSDGATVTAQVYHKASTTNCGTNKEVAVAVGATTTTLLCTPSNALASPGLRIDLLDDGLGLRSGLARLASPYGLVMTTGATGGASQYAAVWHDVNGLEGVKGTGSALASFSMGSATASSRLVFTPRYTKYPNQALSYEAGALVTSRSTTQAISSAPSFNVTSTATGTNLSLELVHLAGSGSVSGAGQATVMLHAESRTDSLLTGTNVAMTLTGPTAAGWCGFLRDELLIAGATTPIGSAHCATASVTYTLPAATATLGWNAATQTTTLTVAPAGPASTVTLHLLQVNVDASIQ